MFKYPYLHLSHREVLKIDNNLDPDWHSLSRSYYLLTETQDTQVLDFLSILVTWPEQVNDNYQSRESW